MTKILDLNTSTNRPIFIIGTGRSGTHWLGYSLGNHPEIRTTIEVEPMFTLSQRMALDATLEEDLFDDLIVSYKQQLSLSPHLYLDKSHHNIWLVEKIKKVFPNALFIGIERNPFATVASMMKHTRLTAWHKRWREFPVPNRFLGITEEMSSTYSDMPLASQCAIRWVAHHTRMNEIKIVLDNDLLIISYEEFAQNTKQVIHELEKFIGVNSPIPIPNVKTSSLHKWKTQLSTAQIKQVRGVIEKNGL